MSGAGKERQRQERAREVLARVAGLKRAWRRRRRKGRPRERQLTLFGGARQ